MHVTVRRRGNKKEKSSPQIKKKGKGTILMGVMELGPYGGSKERRKAVQRREVKVPGEKESIFFNDPA